MCGKRMNNSAQLEQALAYFDTCKVQIMNKPFILDLHLNLLKKIVGELKMMDLSIRYIYSK